MVDTVWITANCWDQIGENLQIAKHWLSFEKKERWLKKIYTASSPKLERANIPKDREQLILAG